MQVNNERFYVVQTPDNSHVIAEESEAINHLKQNGTDLDPESDEITVVEVTFSGDDWTIKELPWQRIALQLLQE